MSEINFASSRDHVIFFLLYNIFTIYNDVCGDFPKIFESFSKFVRRPDEDFLMFSVDFRTFYED